MNMTTLLQIAGLMYLGIIAAGATMPRVVHLPEHIRTLPEFIRRLFWVYYGFIGTCLQPVIYGWAAIRGGRI